MDFLRNFIAIAINFDFLEPRSDFIPLF